MATATPQALQSAIALRIGYVRFQGKREGQACASGLHTHLRGRRSRIDARLPRGLQSSLQIANAVASAQSPRIASLTRALGPSTRTCFSNVR